MALILLVEDDESVRTTTAEMMRELGHEVVDADSAEAAMPLLHEMQVDVLVTDVGLPGTSGEVFAAEARVVRPGMRVIFVTGGDSIADRTADGSSPILLRKPFDLDALDIALGPAV